MNILVVYATFSSGTKVAAEAVASHLANKGENVTVRLAAETEASDIENHDFLVFASPSWYTDEKDGMPHDDFIQLQKRLEGKVFEGKKCAVFGLGDNTYAHYCGAVDHLESMVNQFKGKLVAPSLRIDSFFTDQEEKQRSLRTWADTCIEAAKK